MAEAKLELEQPKKVGRPRKVNGAGRPSQITPETMAKLKEAFAFGASDPEACFYAGVSENALYIFQNKNPEFVKEKNLLKERPTLMARQSVVNGLAGDPNLALKYLERKRKSEFAVRTDITSGDEPIKFTVVRQTEAIEGEVIEDGPSQQLLPDQATY